VPGNSMFIAVVDRMEGMDYVKESSTKGFAPAALYTFVNEEDKVVKATNPGIEKGIAQLVKERIFIKTGKGGMKQ